MKVYFLKIILTSLVVFGLYAVVLYNVRSPITAEYWVHQMMLLKRHQAGEIKSPKIIVLGGSNVLFSVDAATMEHELNMPTYNYGLHAGMRLEWVLEEGRLAAKPGDILILILEPAYYVKGNVWSEWELRNALAWNSEWVDGQGLIQRFRTFLQAGTLDMAMELLKMKVLLCFSPDQLGYRLHVLESDDKIVEEYHDNKAKKAAFSYSFLNIDDHGLMMNAKGSKYLGSAFPIVLPSAILPYPKQLLSLFIKEMEARNVRVYFANSPYLVDANKKPDWKEADRKFCAEIQDLGSEVIDHREQLFFPRSDFFDTVFHLNTKGRDQRTKILIEALNQKLKDIDPSRPSGYNSTTRMLIEKI